MASDDVEKNNTAAPPGGEEETGEKREILYTVTEVPPWYLCILLGFQQFLTAFGATFSYPILMAPFLCMVGDSVGLSELIGTVIFVSGLSTLLQTTLGVRLPIIQSISYSFITPVISLMSISEWQCPYTDPSVNATSLPEVGSDGHRSMWKARLAEVQGALMVSSLFQIVIGFSGLMGLLMNFIGPLTITPTIALIGLSLFEAASDKASTQWWISLTTVALIAVFSQYLRNVRVPWAAYSRRDGCSRTSLPIFNLFPVLLAIVSAWVLCVILTVTGALPDDPKGWGYQARTDTRTEVLHKAKWFRFPYPGQWGVPTVSVAGVFGMLAALLASMIESVGDYYACARLAGAPPPPGSAVSRGIGMEGVTCLIAGAWGTGGGTTSYSENIGAIGITKVGSRVVIQVGAAIMIVLGCLGKFGALFVTIPDPVVGGMFIVMFGMVTAVGISNLHFVDLGSIRNLFILGISLFFGLAGPRWVSANSGKIQTGNDIANQIISVLLGTSMFVGGFIAAFLDNTIPGTVEERGILKWRKHEESSSGGDRRDTLAVYDLPLIQKYLNKLKFTRYIPFCPHFILDERGSSSLGGCCQRRKGPRVQEGAVNAGYEDNTRM
ncbi:solute carrier family 23 member 1-like [Haliotis rufescens]|uniref:solute carrier family 23 member 1-like n=1 Tax=Haliotis rufescens TaxID=6454 RepID=UPI00201EECC1|nr:solute carrier family 23 member 1-like [Haliotis rufescens]XP_048244536.1 solute carrier family 23 member 1-like [Haliotis rufescens]XP_048244537.1 solute carrier family 23 member 1-like [Haliotis rufescens]XP_048244542.1 solute carrier family 23 member 1-like [Haliotis rufescens]XP_048244546.1 solute carrier family 23 member 1-like [Haliotis rufescens]XP_048244550.1 solute carrier family 23 member 1-like [Haliotis rufescens]XP_048244555.1 solute carrier family 23 member 1-like [Haliotis r